MQYLPEILAIITAIFLYLIFEKLSNKYIIAKLNSNYHPMIKTALRLFLIFVISITLMSEAGIDVNALLTSFGISGLAISLASREVLSNIISGIMLQVQRPYKLGDLITVKSQRGKVIEINLRFTILKSDDKTILIPNRIMLSDPIIIES